jgi:hypothetical protein
LSAKNSRAAQAVTEPRAVSVSECGLADEVGAFIRK